MPGTGTWPMPPRGLGELARSRAAEPMLERPLVHIARMDSLVRVGVAVDSWSSMGSLRK